MVKHGDFKTCEQSTFCVRHRAFEELKAAGEGPVPWKWEASSAKFGAKSISAFLSSDDFQEMLKAEFTILADNTVRFKLVEKDPLHPRYEFPFGLESEPNSLPYQKQIDEKSGKITVTFDSKNSLEIIPSPFSFTLSHNSKPAIAFNSRGLLYYEPYRKEQTVPHFAIVHDEGLSEEEKKDIPDDEKKIIELKKKLSRGLGSDDFNGKTDSKPKGIPFISNLNN